ncbi:ATP-binding protein [Aequorivita sp. KMM 9714]|uniref:hybrid sensor histidine kinase/response regulator n=1 Tax=Aequorivita sp. KMM 9714 TaxID=2707173 RepID=UPI0013EC7A0C|nr:ATP-binding protein [Aequorivita sp. KMM 9714]NGX82763.1 response regulator [Aequorivita sp. KMM 9714]
MANSRNKFTLKIILSYLVLIALAVLVGFFLYSEFQNYTAENIEKTGEKKFIETGTLINLVYETDGFSRLALLSESEEDYEKYVVKTDSLFKKIKEIKSLTVNDFQIKQLDSVKSLIEEKNRNIEQLRILRLTNQKDTSLDDIMREVRKLEASVGLNSVESLIKDPSQLSRNERRIWQNYADYLNRDSTRDTAKVRSKTVDSMLIASRYIVAEAKKLNSRIRKSLNQQENELIRNDLNISEQLREIIASFDREISKNNLIEKQKREASIKRTGDILKFAGLLGGIVVLLFSYFILSDFFRADRYKKNLEASKNYAETLLKSREQLISTVSHDLKTPLNTISGYSELIENSSLSEKQKYYLSQITSSSQFISQLVDDLLDFSKLEAGKLPLENVAFSLENIIENAANAVHQQYIEKPVALKISISESIKNKFYKSDPLRIRQVVNNLLGNAFKFTEKGSVEIRVEELSKAKTGVSKKNEISNIQISVIDTGIGISKEKQELIFNEFTQAETEIAHKFGGNGLGLAISKKLTELLGGTLKVKSVLGKGSTFTLTLPLQHSNRILPTKTKNVVSSFNGLKAIIIDDDQTMRALLKEILEQLNIDSETFSSYEQLKNADSESRVDTNADFVLTDIQMPNTDGFTLLENLKKGEIKAYNNQPVIAMTGSRERNREYYLKEGFAEMLAKPFSKEDLINILKHLFPNQWEASEGSNESNTTNESSKSGDIFNLSLLNSFLSTPEALEEVLNIFNQQTKTDLQLIDKAIEDNDVDKVKEITHRMLTMTRQLQAKDVVAILEKMEEYPEVTAKISNELQIEMRSDFNKLVEKFDLLQQALNNR